MNISPHDVFDWVVALAPVVPMVLHVAGLDGTAVGRVVTALLPDVVGAFKRGAPKASQ